jgi:hypothetical protein
MITELKHLRKRYWQLKATAILHSLIMQEIWNVSSVWTFHSLIPKDHYTSTLALNIIFCVENV